MEQVERKQTLHESTSGRLYFLDSLRAIAIIMVVGVHTLGYCLPLLPEQESVIKFIVYYVSVPVFFLVDGFLFSRSVIILKNYSYYKYLRSSLFRLLVPWTLFTLAYTFARYVSELSGFFKDNLISGHSVKEVVISAYGSIIAPQMYFLFSLFLIRLCAPFYTKLLLIKNYLVLLLLFSCYYLMYITLIPFIYPYLNIDGGQEPVLHALWGVQFYLAGIVLFKTHAILELKKLFVPFLLLFIIVLLIRNNFVGYSLNHLTQYLYLLSLFLFFTYFINGVPILNLIGKNTMGVYLIHAPIVLKGVSLVVNNLVFNPILSFISILFVTVAVSVCITIGINSVPFGCLLFGTSYKGRIKQLHFK